jgi:hypothetical protein
LVRGDEVEELAGGGGGAAVLGAEGPEGVALADLGALQDAVLDGLVALVVAADQGQGLHVLEWQGSAVKGLNGKGKIYKTVKVNDVSRVFLYDIYMNIYLLYDII